MADAMTLPFRNLSEREITRSPGWFGRVRENPGTLSDQDTIHQGSDDVLLAVTTAACTERVRGRIRPLLAMPANWDSYGAPEIDDRIAAIAERVLIRVAIQDFELPAVVPTSSGGLALEWHRPDKELSIELGMAGASVYFCDEAAGREWEQDLAAVEEGQLRDAFASLVYGGTR